MLYDTLMKKNGELVFKGVFINELARKYGTPLMILDTDGVRETLRDYIGALKKNWGDAEVLYASKALSMKAIYRLCAEEGAGIDVVSGGEIFTAKAAGFPMERAYFHGNNKTAEEIALAISSGVGTFVIDGEDDALAIQKEAQERGVTVRALIRVTPGVDAHTHKAIVTGRTDSKFGTPVYGGAAMELTKKVLTLKNVKLCGFHAHVGSQIFESEPFILSGKILLAFIKDVFDKTGFMAEKLNLGGGFGVRYVESDPEMTYKEKIAELCEALRSEAEKLNLPLPTLVLEPGRSVVAAHGITLYTVGSVKEIKDVKNYLSVDGGMTDNPRYALYGAKYTVYAANRMDEPCEKTYTVAGKCCESGDILAEGVRLPEMKKGDTIAVCTTGAYNYSMASNYNRVPRPAVVGLKNGKDELLIRRETFTDVARLDV